jgi:hypothetical protein
MLREYKLLFFSPEGGVFLFESFNGRGLVLAGRWWKFTYNQIHDDSRTEVQSAKTLKKGFLGFCFCGT